MNWVCEWCGDDAMAFVGGIRVCDDCAGDMGWGDFEDEEVLECPGAE